MAVARVEYRNKLDKSFAAAPFLVRAVLNLSGVYKLICSVLDAITGDPDKLAAKGAEYIDASQRIADVAEAIKAARAGTPGWTGVAREEFDAKITEHVEKISELAQAVAKTDDILKAAAQACVQGANLVIDLVDTFIRLSIAALSAAAAITLSYFSFGATGAVWIGANLTRGIQLVQQILAALAALAALLQRLGALLKMVSEIMLKVSESLKSLQRALTEGGQGDSFLARTVGAAIWSIDRTAFIADKAGDVAGFLGSPLSGLAGGEQSGVVGIIGDYLKGHGSAADAARIAANNKPPSF